MARQAASKNAGKFSRNHFFWSTPPATGARNPRKSSLISVHPRPSAVKIPNLKSRLTGEITIFYQIREILVALPAAPVFRP
jgi:hypothetical protein